MICVSKSLGTWYDKDELREHAKHGRCEDMKLSVSGNVQITM